MRTAPVIVAIVGLAAGIVALFMFRNASERLPRVDALDARCAEAMKRPADLHWQTENRDVTLSRRAITQVLLGGLPVHDGDLVRVAGVLRLEFEWSALYASRDARESKPLSGLTVEFRDLWPDEPYWQTKGSAVSDHCVLVEGTYRSQGGRTLLGRLEHVLRLEVWSAP